MAEETNSKGPEHTEQIGRTKLSIWRNVDDNGKERISPVLESSYKAQEGWKSQKINLGHDQLLNVAKIAERGEAYLASRSERLAATARKDQATEPQNQRGHEHGGPEKG